MTDDRIAALETPPARLEERMKTTQAEYKTDIALLARQIAERDTANTRWLVGSIAVATGLIIAAIKFL